MSLWENPKSPFYLLSDFEFFGLSGVLGGQRFHNTNPSQRERHLNVSVAPPAEPRGEKKLFFVQILGGEKLLKFGEKWAVKNF